MRNVIETIPSASGRFKVEIVQRADGHFQICLLRWIEEIVPGYGKVAEFWADQDRTVSITDDIEVARAIARDLLATSDAL